MSDADVVVSTCYGIEGPHLTCGHATEGMELGKLDRVVRLVVVSSVERDNGLGNEGATCKVGGGKADGVDVLRVMGVYTHRRSSHSDAVDGTATADIAVGHGSCILSCDSTDKIGTENLSVVPTAGYSSSVITSDDASYTGGPCVAFGHGGPVRTVADSALYINSNNSAEHRKSSSVRNNRNAFLGVAVNNRATPVQKAYYTSDH